MKNFTRSLAVSALVLSASSANAALIAGWDFSQYFSDGVHSFDGSTAAPADVQANYSSLDPNGAGAQAAAFGTLHLPFVPVGDGSEALLPAFVSPFGSLQPNLGQGPYDQLTLLTNEGQVSANTLSMVATQQVSIVFEANLTSVPQTGSDWSVTLAAATQGGAGSILIEFSSDGVAYASLGSFAVSSSAIAISANAALGTSDRAFFRLTLSQGTIIDNVGLSANLTAVPEPAVASLLAAGLFGLARFGRRRA